MFRKNLMTKEKIYGRNAYRKDLKAQEALELSLIHIFTVADEDKAETFPLVKRFYKLGFNIVATEMTADYLKERGIRTRVYGKICEGNDDILRDIRSGKINYVINTRAVSYTHLGYSRYFLHLQR